MYAFIYICISDGKIIYVREDFITKSTVTCLIVGQIF